MDDSPGKRLASFRKSLGLNQRSFAAVLGVSPGRIGTIETNAAEPSRAFLQKISKQYLISADWLLNGHGDMYSDPVDAAPGFQERRIEAPDYTRPAHGDFVAGGEEYSLIERADLSTSAGTGLAPTDGGQRDRIALSRTWLRRNRVNAQLAVLIRMVGDSMAPGIPDGALLLVHCAESTVDKEGIYAFLRGDKADVKRLVPAGKQPDGKPAAIIIVSDNRAYPTESVSTTYNADGLRVIGRVRCVMATYD